MFAAQFDYEDLGRQRDALKAAGCQRVWTDRRRQIAAGDPRQERTQLLAYLRAGDVLVVWRLDRLADTGAELAQLVTRLRQRAIGLRSLEEGLDSTLPGGEQLFAAICATAGLDAGERAAKPDGDPQRQRAAPSRRGGGRPASLSTGAHARVRQMYEAGEHTIDQIAATHGVSRATVYRSLKHTASQN